MQRYSRLIDSHVLASFKNKSTVGDDRAFPQKSQRLRFFQGTIVSLSCPEEKRNDEGRVEKRKEVHARALTYLEQ